MQATFKIILSCLLCLVMSLSNGCGSEGADALRGIWVWESRPGSDVFHAIQFSGNSFTLTTYPRYVDSRGFVPDRWLDTNSFVGRIATNSDTAELTPIETIGNPGDSIIVYRSEVQGTYAITDDEDKIEFKFNNGDIRVYSFERTENTIAIGGQRFIRRERMPERLPRSMLAPNGEWGISL